jgi:hypothetical protein
MHAKTTDLQNDMFYLQVYARQQRFDLLIVSVLSVSSDATWEVASMHIKGSVRVNRIVSLSAAPWLLDAAIAARYLKFSNIVACGDD